MNAKRVLVVSTTDMGFNGITSVIMNYYRYINREKIQFDFVICEEIHKSVEEEITNLGGKIYRVPSRKKQTIKYIKELKKIVIEKGYKIVHVHGNSGTIYLDIHALKKVGVPVRIAHSHNSTCNHKLIHKILKRPLNKEITKAIACSKLAGDWLFNREYTILNNGIDIDKFLFNESVRQKYRKDMNLEDKMVIGHIGHFSYQKNHEFLIEIFKEVHDINQNAVLMLVGDGELKGEIEEKIDQLGLRESVILLGKRNDAAELMQAMDLFVLPSRFEGLPVVLVEAQTAGLKCVVSEVITKECQITNNIEFIDLNKKSKYWAQKINNNKYIRNNIRDIIVNSNFNIKNESDKLEKIYLENF